ncbi:T9SS type A sorting domain-containing protein [Segetibacter sp. 3557_3]|uniref:T9SS type A sorting domain-containing protein n=1 Tax=Segetibacter sp. 3557_3 TaxID=2547429 RepID=UPI001058D4AA|nr:T9SS type A sorting domain-containing protein [Segetibacter sp. 3557_3]TDH18266.1 T9SS type A sorting domain-containing protein [Segetibacter sp. 3557_3]
MKTFLTLLFFTFLSYGLCAQPGTLDPTFGNGGKVLIPIRSNTSDQISDIGIQKDGKIVAGGSTQGSINNTRVLDFALARFNLDGSLDNSFDADGKVTTLIESISAILAIAVQNDGKIVAAGWSSGVNDYPRNITLARYNVDGSLDQTFNGNGIVITLFGGDSYAHAIAIQNDGKIVVVGRANSRFALVRYNPNGSLDNTFNGSGIVTTQISPASQSDAAYALAIQKDGKIIAVGDNATANPYFNVAVVRYNTDGSLDVSFDGDGKLAGPVRGQARSVALQNDGKIVVGGYPDSGFFLLSRFNSDGSLDLNFDGDGVVNTRIQSASYAQEIAIQNDGKIVAGGSSYDNRTSSDFAAARYETNGNLDQTFGNGGIVVNDLGTAAAHNDFALAMKVAPNRIYLAGYGSVSTQFAIVAYKNDEPTLDCSNEFTPPSITTKNVMISLDASGQANIKPSDVIQRIFDNCSLDSSSITVTPNTFTCASISSGENHQAYIANTITGNQDFYGELGLDFTVNVPDGIVVDQLGAFDDQGNGITGTQDGGIRVSIFNKVTQKPIPGLDVRIVGKGDYYTANYRFKKIAPISLPKGTYVIVAKGYNLYEKNGNVGYNDGQYPLGDSGSGAITFGTTAYWGENIPEGFSFPNHSASLTSPAYLAGSFSYSGNQSKYQAYMSSTSTGNQEFLGELGLEFAVNSSGIIISQLGAFDHQGNGVKGTQNGGVRVAIFDKQSRSIVLGLDTIVVGNADSYSSNYRFTNITPVFLPEGEYVVVAKGYNQNEKNGNIGYSGGPYPTQQDGAGLIKFVNTPYWGENITEGFSFPNHSSSPGNLPAYLAGTFKFGTSAPSSDHIVTISAKDLSGNVATATAHVVLQDPHGICKTLPNTINTSDLLITQTKNSAEVLLRKENIVVYPNPNRGNFRVQLKDLKLGKASVQVFNTDGKLIEHRPIQVSSAKVSLEENINLTHLPSGIYIIKVIDTGGVRTSKVVVEH